MNQHAAWIDKRIDWAVKLALARSASDREIAILIRVFKKHLAEYQIDEAAARQYLSIGSSRMPADMDLAELAAWTSVARVILNLHETITRS